MNMLALIPIAMCAAIIYLGETMGRFTSESKKLFYSLMISQCSAFLIQATDNIPVRIVLSVITIASLLCAMVNLALYSKPIISRYINHQNHNS